MHIPVMYDIPVLLRGKVFEVVLEFRGAVRGAEEIGDFGRVAGGAAVLLQAFAGFMLMVDFLGIEFFRSWCDDAIV